MLAFPEKMWTSTELLSCYQEYGGEVLSQQLLTAELQSHFGKDVLILSSPGIASSLLHIDDEDDDDLNFDKLGRTIQKEISAIPQKKDIYHKRIDFQLTADDTSPTALQVGLAILANKPQLVEHLYDYYMFTGRNAKVQGFSCCCLVC